MNQLLTESQLDVQSALPPAVRKALQLARRLQERASQLQTPAERNLGIRANEKRAEIA